MLRRLDGMLHGDYRTLFRGFGLDLADLREYQYNDDVRHIDWNVTARMQQPYVRTFNEEREVTAWFLLDLSPSLDFGSSATLKRSVSAEFVAVLTRLLTKHGNRVGALFYGEEVDTFIPSRAGRRHVLHLLHRMTSREPRTAARRDRPRRVLPHRGRNDEAPLAGVRRLRLHQQAGLGRGARPPVAPSRGRRRAAVRSARDGAARPRADRHPGCGDRRAGARGHARREVSCPLRRGRQATGAGGARLRCARRRSTRWSFAPTTTSRMRSSASPTCASAAASWRPAAACPAI